MNRQSAIASHYEPLIILAFTLIILPPIFLFYQPAHSTRPPKPADNKETSDSAQQRAVSSHNDTLANSIFNTDPQGDTYTGLWPFFRLLTASPANTTATHIAYFGDSMIEGDLVTHPLRRRLQKRFGGNGVGFVPITSPEPGFRLTIRQSFNNRWKTSTFVKPPSNASLLPGLSGYAFESSENASVTFQSENIYGRFHSVRVLAGPSVMQLRIGLDSAIRSESFSFDVPLGVCEIKPDSAFSRFTLEVESSAPATLYGCVFEQGPGIYLDNYAFRGNSGLPLRNIPVSQVKAFVETLNNQLIILHFGLNVFTPGVDDYHWYAEGMLQVIRHLRTASPEIPILVISMPDRAGLNGTEYSTPPELPGFIAMQKRVADEAGVAFFNLYEAMGGRNSMKNWVEGKPKLAGDDYTHPNGSGAIRIAEYIYEYLMAGLDLYNRQQNLPAQDTTALKL